ncbi:MAG: ABC transporter permease [Archangium sp.]|nr:ABC transporter permease [Archangium sp.]
MKRYVFRRLLLMIPTFFGISLLTFLVARLAPGDPFLLDLETGELDPEAIARARAAQGLDAPLPLQFARWMFHLVRFDFGRSLIDQRLVTEKIFEAMPRTALVAGLAMILGFGLAIPLGVWLSTRRDRWGRAVEALLLTAWSVPSFWIAVMALMIFAGPRFLDLFPVQGLENGGFVLPVICLAFPTIVVATRQVRAAMEEALAQDYVKAARARGIPERRVIWKHALRNSLLPVVTMFGLHLPHLVGGSVIIERIFGVPGMGLLAFDSIGSRDYPTIMGVATVMAIATMTSMLLVDLAYGFIDPRIRLERAK